LPSSFTFAPPPFHVSGSTQFDFPFSPFSLPTGHPKTNIISDPHLPTITSFSDHFPSPSLFQHECEVSCLSPCVTRSFSFSTPCSVWCLTLLQLPEAPRLYRIKDLNSHPRLFPFFFVLSPLQASRSHSVRCLPCPMPLLLNTRFRKLLAQGRHPFLPSFIGYKKFRTLPIGACPSSHTLRSPVFPHSFLSGSFDSRVPCFNGYITRSYFPPAFHSPLLVAVLFD